MSEHTPQLRVRWIDFGAVRVLDTDERLWRARFETQRETYKPVHWGVLLEVPGELEVFAQVQHNVQMHVPTPCCRSLSDAQYYMAETVPSYCAKCKEQLPYPTSVAWAPKLTPRHNTEQWLETWWGARTDPLRVALYVGELAHRFDRVFGSKVLAKDRAPDPALHRVFERVRGPL